MISANAFLRFTPPLLILFVLAFLPAVTFGQIQNSPDDRPGGSQAGASTSPPPGETQRTQHDSAQAPPICGITHPGQCLKDVGHDQIGIWTSPLRIKPRDAFWLAPFVAATGLALHYDAQAQQELGIDKTRIDASNTISDVGLYGSMGGGGALYLLGLATHNDHLAETGRLGEEAIANALLVVQGLKLATNRERPDEGDGRGGFWRHGTRHYELDGSFPSGHAAVSWSFARVIASEYPSKPVQIGAYAFALAISASRVTARKHFPSDVLVGSTLGYLIGGYVVHHHTDGGPASTLMIAPMMEQSTRTYGFHLDFMPGDVNLSKAGSFISWLRGTR
jgi:hypothetical protein